LSVIPSEVKNVSTWVRRAVMLWAACLLATAIVAQKKPPGKPIDINTASIEQLEQLPGVGPVTAKSIFDFRKKSGPFRRTEDLLAIRGISEKRFQAIAPYIVVTQSKPTASAKVPASKPPGSGPKPMPAAPKQPAAPKPAPPR
jgi:competence ComEA-like helix-hairpin-helix protein